ncbi:aminotransferase class I/II-fold pyridoxal phosphate-dependent enzyme [Rhodocytophaga rosea]|uniref:Aminotransferase class I/II-fold pyridoxal phosphate-dependent enzyme n=1 Tax=Rhodocytophaga rosea TaxID=2704465 RepID=A0A6C0GVN3_9BACT|nr:aminotransferase class I/II-fold pyridoxal phosphate-dependent enzyme [Rhodocytophaga rosea]QHT71372.1 aminotransferase class I/II-fold pyridoxal phosphate-dependent enzyme [Rhodocytophaga rosea]
MKETLYIDHLPDRTILVEGKEFLYCSGTSYLGMAKNEVFSSFLQEGMARYGTNYASSRISNLQLQVYQEAEAYLSQLTGAEAAVTLSSGFLTGQMVVRLLENTGMLMYAPRTHPALWRSADDFFDGDYQQWVDIIMDVLTSMSDANIVILTNSLDPLQAKRYSFDWLQHLPTDKSITLVVDDSHGFGITGKNGAGIFQELIAYKHIRPIVVSSFGKAFGIPGGVVLSDRATVETFKRNPFFGGSSPVIPAYLYTFLRSENLYQQERQKLFANIRQFESFISNTGLFEYFPDYPVFYTRENTLATYLKENNILISSFPYPSPESKLVTRVVINSLHTPDDIFRLAQAINRFVNLM